MRDIPSPTKDPAAKEAMHPPIVMVGWLLFVIFFLSFFLSVKTSKGETGNAKFLIFYSISHHRTVGGATSETKKDFRALLSFLFWGLTASIF